MAASSAIVNYDDVVVSSLVRHLAPSHLERLKTLLFSESGMAITGERTPQTTPYSRWEVIALQNLFAPIRRLPPEMLSEIFDHCCQNFSEGFDSYNDAFKRPCKFHGRCPPMVMILGQVCSIWRGVVQSTPKLWTRLDICIGRRARYREYEFFIQELSTRNPSLPVQLHVRNCSLDNTRSRGSTDVLVYTVLFLSSRLESIKAVLSFDDLHSLFVIPGIQFPLLGKVDIRVIKTGFRTHYIPPDPEYSSINTFQNAHALRRFSITSGSSIPNPHILDKPFSLSPKNLTSLSISHSRGTCLSNDTLSYFKMLCACVNLHECSIAFPRSADPEPSATIKAELNALGITVLPALSRLDIQFDFDNFSMPYLFDYLALPGLRFLSIKGPFKASTNALGNHLVKLQKRSGFSLEKLALCCIGEQVFLTKHLVKLLWRQPELQSLSLSECGFYLPDIIGPMHFYHSSSTLSPLLPQLEELVVVADGHYFVAGDDDPYYLSGVIASRWWTCESDEEVEKGEGEKTESESVERKFERSDEDVGCFDEHGVARIYRVFICRNDGEFERTDRKNLRRCRADGLDLVVTDESQWDAEEDGDTDDEEDEGGSEGAGEGTVKRDGEEEEFREG